MADENIQDVSHVTELGKVLRRGTKLIINPPGEGGAIKSELMGLSPMEFIIAKLPMSPGVRDMFPEGNPVVVRFLAEGTVYGFRVPALNLVTKPELLLFMAFPKAVERHHLRKDPRFKCLLPVQAELEAAEVSGMVLDLSRGGCCLMVKRDQGDAVDLLEKEDELGLRLSLFDQKGAHAVKSEIRAIHPSNDAVHLGLQFTEIDDAARSDIDDYLAEAESRAKA